MKTRGLAGLVVVVWVIIGGAIGISAANQIRAYHRTLHEVTWYQAGEVTKSGSYFDPKDMACAVRNPQEMNHLIQFEYNDKAVIVWANDLMPPNSKAEYDLTPAAFMKLAPLSVGRLRGVRVSVINE